MTTNTDTSWEERFDNKFCRIDMKTGLRRDGWFFPETLTPREVKSFIRELITKAREEERNRVLTHIAENVWYESRASEDRLKKIIDDIQKQVIQNKLADHKEQTL